MLHARHRREPTRETYKASFTFVARISLPLFRPTICNSRLLQICGIAIPLNDRLTQPNLSRLGRSVSCCENDAPFEINRDGEQYRGQRGHCHQPNARIYTMQPNARISTLRLYDAEDGRKQAFLQFTFYGNHRSCSGISLKMDALPTATRSKPNQTSQQFTRACCRGQSSKRAKCR